MPNNKCYYDDFLRIIAKKLDISGFEYKSHEELSESIDETIIEDYRKFIDAYEEYSNFFYSTYKDEPFNEQESKQYWAYSEKMSTIREQIMKKIHQN